MTSRLSYINSHHHLLDIIPIVESIPYPEQFSLNHFISRMVNSKNTVLLEGVSQQVKHDQFTYIGIDPYIIIEDWNGKITETAINSGAEKVSSCSIYDYLKNVLSRYSRIPDTTAPFSTGIMGLLSYESVSYLENISFNKPRRIGIPLSSFVIPRVIITVDNYKKQLDITYSLFTESFPIEHAQLQLDLAFKKIQEIKGIINASVNQKPFSPLPFLDPTVSIPYSCNITKSEFLNNIKRCQSYILDGDIFQVQFSRRASIPFDSNPFNLYAYVRCHNPSPLMFYTNFNDVVVLGSSPELLVNVDQNKMTIRPIAGTRKRFSKNRSEADIIHELCHDEKEKAEHIMLVDLARHDIGRACQTNSVVVNELMYIEKYSHVIHLVSDVVGQLKPNYDAIDALKFGFPAGTVTGAPKIRAIEIIEDLENEQREFYAGGVVFADFTGDLKSALTIRTICVKDGMSYTQAAGGVVADSIPEMEYLETENKMKMSLTAMYQYGTNKK